MFIYYFVGLFSKCTWIFIYIIIASMVCKNLNYIIKIMFFYEDIEKLIEKMNHYFIIALFNEHNITL
jgi:hypothetical protein